MSFMAVSGAGPRIAIHRLMERFVERGAVSAGQAMTLDQLGIVRRTPAFGLLHLRGYIVEVEPDRYYFDAEEWEANPLHKLREKMTDRIAGLEDEDDGLDYPANPPAA